MRTPILAGNWKMNLSLADAKALAEGIKAGLSKRKNKVESLVFPSDLHIPAVSEIFKGTEAQVGVQNVYPSDPAAFTGETSLAQVSDFGVKTILLGHSERRQFLGETNEFLNKKIHFCLQKGFIPLYCIGETLPEREANQTMEVVKKQIEEGLKGVSVQDAEKLILAYEPVWAIGTGKTATPAQAEEVHLAIRGLLKSLFGESVSEKIRILYGGSVKPDNISDLMKEKNIDGGLVGGASLKADSYLALFEF
jgi:triosephosphate isomerase